MFFFEQPTQNVGVEEEIEEEETNFEELFKSLDLTDLLEVNENIELPYQSADEIFGDQNEIYQVNIKF